MNFKSITVLLFAILLLTGSVFGKVIRLDNVVRIPVLDNYSFGNTGAYEFLTGTLVLGINPKNEFNKMICDLDLAPVNPTGWIEAKTKFIVLQPSNPSKRNGIAFIEVSNRGGISILRYYNDAVTGQIRPGIPADFGNEYLMKHGYTLVWIGWQWDLPESNNGLILQVPSLKNKDGTSIKGMVRADWVIDKPTHTPLNVGHRTMNAYPVEDIHSSLNKLTIRKKPLAPRITIPPDQWSFTRQNKPDQPIPDSIRISNSIGFEPGNIYELIYQAKDPVLAGYSLAAIRDIASYIKYDTTCPFPAHKTLVQGVSQTGRFLRQFLFDGFNKDESGRLVYDGMMIFMAGAGRGSFNHRFAQPSRDAHRYSSFDYPTDLYPFSSVKVKDPFTGKTIANRTLSDSLKIFYINSGYEYWGRGASLIQTDPAGISDLPLPANERYFHIASMQHYGESLPDSTRRIFPQYDLYKGHPLNPLPCFKALLMQMKQWMLNEALPVNNKIPTIKEGTLIKAINYKIPFIPGLVKPVSPYIPASLYFGPRWAIQKIIDQEPPVHGHLYTPLVPDVDVYGNETGGIQLLELRVPLATYTPWSLRYGLASPGEMDDFRGLFIPLPKSKFNRVSKETRPDFASLYSGKDDYLHKIDRELANLVAERFLLEEDVTVMKKHSLELWDWIQTFYQSK